MQNISSFKDVAPYLTNPLVLIGFVVMLGYGVHQALISAEIVRRVPLGQKVGLVRSFLRYGFAFSILVILLGFALAFYQTHEERAHDSTPASMHQSATATDGSTAINIGNDVNYERAPPTGSKVSEVVPNPARAETTLPVHQEAKAEDGGVAINIGNNINVGH